MNGVNIGSFDPSSPADTESAGLGDDRLRSIKTTLQQVLNDEHNFASAGGANTGYHRLGSARAYWGTQSQVSSSGTDGRLMVTSDTSRIFHVGSAGTILLGGPKVVQMGDTPGNDLPIRHYWAEEVGVAATGSGGTALVTIPNSGFSGEPAFVSVTLLNRVPSQLSANFILSVQTVGSNSGFVVWASKGTNADVAGGVPFFWRSIGSRVL